MLWHRWLKTQISGSKWVKEMVDLYKYSHGGGINRKNSNWSAVLRLLTDIPDSSTKWGIQFYQV